MLGFSILIYLLFTLGIGLYASQRVKSTGDFLLAGKKLPLYLDTATVFATWFGSESVLGASSEMSKHGLMGVIEDPFGAGLCLLLVGLFFARPLYRMKLVTFGDFYRKKYNRTTEVIAGILLVISYFGWVAAQMMALGIVFNVVFDIGIPQGIFVGSVIVILYTFLGGMWSVALTDLIQTIVIIFGLLFVTYEVSSQLPFAEVLEKTPAHFFRFVPYAHSGSGWLNYAALWMTIGLGSIAGQDVFQRVMSAKNETVAVRSSILAAFLYLSVVMMPLILALYARILYPELLNDDPQLMIPHLVMQHGILPVKILFFGALISAIMSTASGATLAPAAILSENLLRPFYRHLSDKKFLLITRLCVVAIACLSLLIAYSSESIFELVAQSSQMTLVTLFIPMTGALFLNIRNSAAAITSMIAGLLAWIACLMIKTEINPLIFGLAAGLLGYSIVLLLNGSGKINLPKSGN